MRRKILTSFLSALVLCAGVLVVGCAGSLRAQVDRAEVLYGETVKATNDLREARAIDATTFVYVVTPARKSAREAIDAARAALGRGETGAARVFLEAANAALLKLEQYRHRPTAAPAVRTYDVPDPLRAGVDPVSAGFLLLSMMARLAPIAGKLFRGEELTAAERDLAERVSADETARADRLVAEARNDT